MLTVYGIETGKATKTSTYANLWLQQCLPFTVLKRPIYLLAQQVFFHVATVLTVYGIETPPRPKSLPKPIFQVATVLTVYGIETVSKACT